MSRIGLNARRTAGGLTIEWVNPGALLTDAGPAMRAAGVLALNRTALESVAAVRRDAGTKFTQRGDRTRRFIDLSFTVTQFATAGRPEIAFGISRNRLQGRASFLVDHELGTTRVAKGPGDFPYIPAIGSSLRPSRSDLLPRWVYPKALGLTDGRAKQNRNVFIMRAKGGDPIGIFRRVPLAQRATRRRQGKGPTTLERLFATPNSIRIKPRLDFQRTAEHVMIERINVNFEGMLRYTANGEAQARNAAWSRADAALIQQYTRRTR